MKNVIIPLAVIVYCTVQGCQSKSGTAVPAKAAASKQHNTVLLDTALNNISNYAMYCNSRPFHTPICAYEIEGADLSALLGGPDSSNLYAVRGYLGIQDSITSKGDTMKTTHLYLTPVRQDGKDSILTDKLGNNYLYDLTTPCPKTCDDTSPLYKAFYKVWIPK